FYSLQKGNSAEADFLKMKDQYWPENNLFNVVSELNDFSDTAALIENLDLVISVDTAVAHLAAALGKPVWLLNRFDSEWRWLGHRKDSPWYPTLKIYNQPKPGDWDSVMRAICVDVSELTRHH
ncbi:MAG: hypothetical protein JHC80_08765, partial [Polynucleobacter sp.]|nr:hypothetical protein [Polynucleobacter sp.]